MSRCGIHCCGQIRKRGERRIEGCRVNRPTFKHRKIRVGGRSSNPYAASMIVLDKSQDLLDYDRIEKAISFLAASHLDQPDLATAAKSVHMSEFHFQRVFTRWAGISP